MKKSRIVYEIVAVAMIGIVAMCNNPTTPTDTAGPVISLVTPATDSATTASSSYTVTLKCTDASGVLSVNGVMGSATFTGVSDAGGAWKIDLSGLVENTCNMITITATDNSPKTNRTLDTLYLTYLKEDKNILLSEGFETDTTPLLQYTYAPGWGIMSRTTVHAHTGSYSLTSDSSRTGIKKYFDIIQDSIAGLQFYLMATKAEQINFGGAIARSGSAWDGLFAVFGMGISKSDSLQYVYQYQPDDPTNEKKCFAPLQVNKWYQCRIEYNFTTTTLTYFLDGAVVGTKTPPSVMSLSMFVTVRDELGSPGPRGYYIDDVSAYKR